MTTSISLGSLQGSSREALRQSLLGVLGPEGETKRAAEQRIEALEIMEQYGVHLIEFILDSNYELAVRKLAATKLKHHVETRWDSEAPNFQRPETTSESKTMIRELLPVGLRDPDTKIRTAVVKSIFLIAQWDWPEEWPQLLDVLVSYLNDDKEFSTQGALSVLNQLTADDLTETQIQYGSSVILREMYRIYDCEDRYSVKLRKEAVEVFTQMVSTISGFEKPVFIEQYLEPVIPKFCQKFVETLRTENDVRNNDLKMNIVKAIHVLLAKLPKCIADYLPRILPLVWEILMDIARDYQENTVNGGDNINEQIDFDAITTFEFLAHLMTGTDGYESGIPSYNLPEYHWFYLLDNYIPPESLHHLINLLQITEKQVQAWNNNVNLFIFDEELKPGLMSIDNVRGAAEELLIAIVDHPERSAANSLIVIILKQLEAESITRASGNARKNENWWKSYEAILFAFGLAKEIIITRQKAGTLHFDLNSFFENVVFADLDNPESHPLLVGRCLCLGGIYANQLPPETATRFLEKTIKILVGNGLTLTKLCAIKATVYWYQSDDSARGNSENEEILKRYLPALYQETHNLGRKLLSRQITILVLRSVAAFVRFDKKFAYSIESKISSLTIDCFLVFRKESWVRSISGDIFKQLTLIPECIGPFQRRLIPRLVSIMIDADPTVRASDACDALAILVKNSPLPLSSLLIDTAFPACCQAVRLASTDDYWPLQSAAQVIHQYVLVAAKQVTGYRNESGKTGSQYIVEVVIYLLNCKHENLACDIMISLMKTARQNLDQSIDQLLKALLTAMQDAKLRSSSRQSLLTVFAHLIDAQFENVFKFLTTAPDVAQRSALAFVLADGFCKEFSSPSAHDDDFKTVILALSKVLQHGVANRDSPLHKINVQGPHRISITTSGGKTVGLSCGRPGPLLAAISDIITSYLADSKEDKAE